jgi:FKBP-type peptidyl-prolyl cis-trans isomerase (trigger factor)
MKNQIKPLAKSKIEVIIEFNNDDLIPFKNKALEELGRNLTLKGYRQGKAPLALVEAAVSPLEVYEKLALFALEKFYPQIIRENKIEALGQPLVSITKLIPNSLVELKLEISVMPHLKLADYHKIAREKQTERKPVTVDDQEITEALTWLQKTKATTDSKTNTKTIPPLDDMFAQSLGNFKNLEELKKNIKEGLTFEKQEKEKERWRLDVMEEIIKQISEEIPDILIEAEKSKMLEELKIRVAEIQLPFEEYLKQIKKTEEELLKDFLPLAEKRVKMALVLKEIADQEKIEITETEIDQKVNEILKQLPDPELKNKINLEELKIFASGLIRNEKVFELLEKQ